MGLNITAKAIGEEEDRYFIITNCILTALLGIIGITLNVLALLAIKRGVRELLPVHRFLIQLGISDILALTCSWPRIISDQIQNDMLSRAADGWGVSVRMLTFFNLAGLATDQYVGVCKPLHYQMILSKKRVILIIVFSWMLSFFTGYLNLIAQSVMWQVDPDLEIKYVYKTSDDVVSYVLFTETLTTACIITVLYVLVIREIRHMSHNGNVSNLTNSKKAIKLTSLMIGSFVFFVVPLSTVNLALRRGRDVEYITECAVWWAMLNYISDPLIYSLRMKDVRSGYRKLCARNTQAVAPYTQ